jgi:GntR family transcriptional regulator
MGGAMGGAQDRTVPLDRAAALPLWAQLAGELRRRLEDGQFEQRFPTDRELTETYGVSRQTAREAVRCLGDQGLLERRRGRGTFLRRAGGPGVSPEDDRSEQPLGALSSLFRAIEAQGVELRSVVRALDARRDDQVAERLHLPAGTDLVYLERLRLAGDEPLALDRAWLPVALAEPLLRADFTRTALDDELARLCGIQLTGSQERLHPVVPDQTQRGILRTRTGEAAFDVERLAWAGERLIEFRSSLVRGGRYEFVVQWSSGSGYSTTMAVSPGRR